MAKDRWIEVLVVGVILTTLAWLAVTVYSLNSTLSRVDGAMQETSKRVDRIAEVLPDMRVKIAGEELNKRVLLLLICEEPRQSPVGSWHQDYKLVNLKENTKTRYRLAVSGPTDQKVELAKHVIRGTLIPNQNTVPISTVVEWLELSGSRSETPDYLDASCSFLHNETSGRSSRRSSAELRKTLEAYEAALSLLDIQETSVRRLARPKSTRTSEIDALLKEIKAIEESRSRP